MAWNWEGFYAIVTNEKADPKTTEFIKFLKGEEAFEIFKSKGFSK